MIVHRKRNLFLISEFNWKTVVLREVMLIYSWSFSGLVLSTLLCVAYVLRVVRSIWSAADLLKCSNGSCSCIVSVLFVSTSEKARNIQERWLVAIL